MNRVRLPNRRAQVSFPVQHGHGTNGAFVVSIGGDGASPDIREVFVSGPPSEMMNVLRDGAILISLALQCGCPLDTIAKALTRDDADRPATAIGTVVAGMMTQVEGGAA